MKPTGISQPIEETDFIYVDWRWLLLGGVGLSLLLLWVMFSFGLKVALAVFVGAVLFFSSIFAPEVPMLVWSLLIINEPFMTGVFNFGAGVNLTNIFLLLIILGWWLGAAVRREDIFRPSPINIPIIVILFFALLSFVRGSSYFGYGLTGEELNGFKRFITCYIVMIMSLNIFRRPIFIKALLAVMVLGLVYETRVTFIQHSSVAGWHYSDKMRIAGSFEGGGGANELGTYFAQGLPFIFAGLLEFPSPMLKFCFFILLLFGIQALFYTYSRGAYLSLFLGLGVISFLKDRRIFIALILLGALSYPLWPVSVRERFSSIEHEDASIKGRKEVWRIARKKIIASPIIGYGYDGSKYLLPRDTHNMYYDVALEMGLPTLFALLYLIYRILVAAYFVYCKSSDRLSRSLALGVIGSTFALLLGNMFGTRLAYLPINMYFAVSSGIVSRLYEELKDNKTL